MSEEKTRLRVKLGAAEIEYEGGTQFLKDEIMPTVGKILEMVEARADLQRSHPVLRLGSTRPVPDGVEDSLAPPAPNSAEVSAKSNGSLPSYLKATGGDSKQVQRFLATAAWLHARGHNNDLGASLVARTLQENHQKKLANPADCLNQNVSKGYCEKTKEGFFITPEGWAALGVQQ